MSDSVYRVTEVIGTSTESWEAAARNAVETAGQTIRDLRIAEATRFDATVQDGKVAECRVRLAISFNDDKGDSRVSPGAAAPSSFAPPARPGAAPCAARRLPA